MSRRPTDARLRGFYGIGVFHSKHEVNIGTLFRSAHAFGASFVYTVGRRYQRQASDTPNVMAHVPLYHFDSIESLKSNLPVGCRIVGVELANEARPLSRYCHPERCVYLLGAEDHGLPQRVLDQCHELVVVPYAARCLNVAVAGSIVLYDRAAKKTAERVSRMELAEAV